jgi:hypothetical protein
MLSSLAVIKVKRKMLMGGKDSGLQIYTPDDLGGGGGQGRTMNYIPNLGLEQYNTTMI